MTSRWPAPIPLTPDTVRTSVLGQGVQLPSSCNVPLPGGSGFPRLHWEPACGPRPVLGLAMPGKTCFLLPVDQGLGGLSALSLWAFPSPTGPDPFFISLCCTWLVYFVRPWEPMSTTWDGETGRQDGQRPGPWDAQGDPGENRKKTGGRGNTLTQERQPGT